MIRLGTLFSGIGAIEQALLRMGEEHINVFACDNGEIELKMLPDDLQEEFDVLKKIPRYRITDEQKNRLAELVEKHTGELSNVDKARILEAYHYMAYYNYSHDNVAGAKTIAEKIIKIDPSDNVANQILGAK